VNGSCSLSLAQEPFGATLAPVPAAPPPDVLERAYRELRGDVRRFVARRAPPAAVDDLTQEIFLRMHEHAADVRDASRLAPWIFRIARSVVADTHRRPGASALDDVPEPAAAEDDEANLNEEVASWIRPMLTLLPPEYAQAIELTELEGLSQKELAERLGLSLSGARSRVQRGRKMLEGVLRACCDFEIDARGNVIGCAVRPDGARRGG
jgi:RNA polymerase sigma-70 factor, ECF subfamily